jgi:hypothetical protein
MFEEHHYPNSLKRGALVYKAREVVSQRAVTLRVTAMRTSDMAINFIIIFTIW